ncbi:anthranilate synthase component I family protein [Microbacterium sp. Bi121]|uniref:anthranilate synthase component I family protein n=1 Tax=Microbacterium sp. Bi121 TaxID=2822348 RepID=UPI001DA76B98|nr:anthranilate synthase component I family protein [Microbacterium sp. Bi121]CAH0164160.1 Anthranilate synthase component 1 [Microbacterium sp. Bi121]
MLRERFDLQQRFRALAAEHANVFWLDAGAGAAEGWSFLGTGLPDAGGPGHVRLDVTVASDDGPPFRNGWIGWLDYESGAQRAGAPAAASEGGPAWLRVTSAVAVDHSSGAVWQLQDAESEWLRLPGSVSERSETKRVERAERVETFTPTATASARHTPDEYADLIERCRHAIRAGDAYQLCLTTRFDVPGAHDPVDAYIRLRETTPAHHGGFVRIGGRALLSASPETFLHASGGVIRTRPIKGTRPRGADAASDAALAAELLASPKERAENVMIVDLMRNDLSQVCRPGSIHVDALWAVESYPAVHQLVSTVRGVAVEGLTTEALWDAAFPAGSMTGAPKLSAMTLLHAFEAGGPRGIYSGCFGYVGADGAVDLAMVIRSIVVDDAHAVVGAGGGITWGSIAADEIDEVATKARAPLAALGAELPEAWRRRRSDILEVPDFP